MNSSDLSKPLCASCGIGKVWTSRRKGLCHACNEKYSELQRAAGVAINKEKNAGRLKKAAEFFCFDCNKPAQCWDHRDYSRPLDVEPVCWSCNERRGWSSFDWMKAA